MRRDQNHERERKVWKQAGLPIMICEFAIGRGSGKSIAKAFESLEPKGTHWHKYKWFGIAGNYLLMMFYTMVGMLDNPGTMIFWTVLAIVLAFLICSQGLQKGVEKITKVMMALSTIVAVFENIIAMSCDMFGWERKKAVGVNLLAITLLSMPAVQGKRHSG